LEIVACVGACGIAPVIAINEDVYGAMNTEKTKSLIKKIRGDESLNV
jgi:NADH-quinone oxidoreductase subunit E